VLPSSSRPYAPHLGHLDRSGSHGGRSQQTSFIHPNGLHPPSFIALKGLTKPFIMPSDTLTTSDMMLPMISPIGFPDSQRSSGSVVTLRQCGSSRPEIAQMHFWNPPDPRHTVARRKACTTSLNTAKTKSVTVLRMLEGHGMSHLPKKERGWGEERTRRSGRGSTAHGVQHAGRRRAHAVAARAL